MYCVVSIRGDLSYMHVLVIAGSKVHGTIFTGRDEEHNRKLGPKAGGGKEGR